MSTFPFFRLFLLILTLGYTLSANAAAPLAVNLYLPQNLNKAGKQIPNTPELTKMFGYFERTAGLRFSIVTLPWKRAQLEVMQGKGILYGFSKSAERLGQYRFSLPVITLQVWAISYGRSYAQFSEVKDLEGKIVTSGLGLSHGIDYDRAKNTLFTVQEDMLPDSARFKRLVSKRSDVILIPFRQDYTRRQVEAFVNNTMVPGFNDPELSGRHFDASLNPLFFDSIHFASAQGHFGDVLDRIDKAITSGTKNDALPKLLRKYR